MSTDGRDDAPGTGAKSIETKNIGLRGVPVADTKISNVDGVNGVLIYRGYDIGMLAVKATFEEVFHLLIFHTLPSAERLAWVRENLSDYRCIPGPVVDTLRALPIHTNPMDVLQAAVPMLGIYDPDLRDESKEASYRKALRLTSRLPLVVTAWDRIRKGKNVVDPDPDLSHAANMLYTLHGERPDEATARDMDVALILHAEQTFNASTFTGRQIASTRAHMYACVAGAIGALSGGLHGGANTQVKMMLEKIAAVENVRPYVTRTLDEGGKIMGMGHAVYKTIDPRATVLKQMAERLTAATGRKKWLALSEKVREVTQEEFRKRKGVDIYPNVDFYSPTVYTLMGIATDLYTTIFAIARVVGWTAHVIEEQYAEAQPKPALYRPKADYVGNYCGPEGCEWTPVEKRS